MTKKLLTEELFIKMARQEYKKRLFNMLAEVDVFDKRGNIIISTDLKVRHTKSGYEYTVDDVIATDDKNIQIVLRSPESPRIEGPGEEGLLGAPEDEVNLIGEQDPAGEEAVIQVTDPEAEETIFVVNQDEFEKEYDVY